MDKIIQKLHRNNVNIIANTFLSINELKISLKLIEIEKEIR